MKHGRGHHKECKLTKQKEAREIPATTVVAGVAVRQVKMRVLIQEVDVESEYDKAANNCLYVEVPRIIEIKIYPSRGKR